VFVRPSVRLVCTEGPRDAKSCRGRDPRRDVVVHATPCGLLLLGLWSNNRVANVYLLCISSCSSLPHVKHLPGNYFLLSIATTPTTRPQWHSLKWSHDPAARRIGWKWCVTNLTPKLWSEKCVHYSDLKPKNVTANMWLIVLAICDWCRNESSADNAAQFGDNFRTFSNIFIGVYTQHFKRMTPMKM